MLLLFNSLQQQDKQSYQYKCIPDINYEARSQSKCIGSSYSALLFVIGFSLLSQVHNGRCPHSFIGVLGAYHISSIFVNTFI